MDITFRHSILKIYHENEETYYVYFPYISEMIIDQTFIAVASCLHIWAAGQDISENGKLNPK